MLARAYLNRMIRDGIFPRANSKACQECGKRAREYHHHRGYAERDWLTVIPVCSICHKQLKH